MSVNREEINRQRQEKRLLRRKENRMTMGRILIVAFVFGFLVFIPLIKTLYDEMIRDHDKYEKMAIVNQTWSNPVTSKRGLIYDANMNILASSATVENVFLDPLRIHETGQDVDLIARGLSEILDVDADRVRELAADVKMRYKVVKRKISQELAQQVRDFINENDLDGIYLEADSQRYYPYSTLAAQILGFVNTDNAGTEGLEAYYDTTLTGNGGKVITTKGNYGSEMLYTYEKYYDASDGNSLVLTVDATVQYYLEKNLENAIEKYSILNGAFGIVMDVNTGAIKGMATLGSYDPNHYSEVYDPVKAEELEKMYQTAILAGEGTEAYTTGLAKYNQEMASARLWQWRNRAVSDGYEPGSTFKLVTIASALNEGAVSLNDHFYCGGEIVLEGRPRPLECWKHEGHGDETTGQALGNSCNIAFAQIGKALGGEKLYDYASAFGMLERTGIDLPGEALGYFYSRAAMNPNADGGLSNTYTCSFGQSFKVTPLQMVRAVSAIVNGGYVLQPYIVSEVLDEDGNVVQQNGRNVLRQVISEETSAIMRTLMESVVTEGTASGAKVPGYRVGGKTGTSEKLDVYDENGLQTEDKMVSFIGVAPIDDPKYVCLVVLDTPSRETGLYISGGIMAAPTVRDVFADILPYLGVEPDYSDEEISAIDVIVPNTVGRTLAEAQNVLRERSLTCRTVGSGSTVTGQIPASGAKVPGNSEIILYFGEEVPQDLITVPDLMGQTVEEAERTAADAGIYLQARGSDRNSGWITVTYQNMEPGTQVSRGTTVTVEFTDNSVTD